MTTTPSRYSQDRLSWSVTRSRKPCSDPDQRIATAFTDASRAATDSIGKGAGSAPPAPEPRLGKLGSDIAACAGTGAACSAVSVAPNTSGFRRTGTPVAVVMRSAIVRRLTLPPVAASSKLSRTGSVKMLGRRSPLPIGTLTDPTQALRARRSTGGAACSTARRSASACEPAAAPCCASVRSPCRDAVPTTPAAWSACTRSDTPGAAQPASAPASDTAQANTRPAFVRTIARVMAPRIRAPARPGA